MKRGEIAKSILPALQKLSRLWNDLERNLFQPESRYKRLKELKPLWKTLEEAYRYAKRHKF